MPAHQILVIVTFVTAAVLLVVLLGSLVHRTPDDQRFWVRPSVPQEREKP